MPFGLSQIPSVATDVLRRELENLEPGGMQRYWSSGAQAIAVRRKADAIRRELAGRNERSSLPT